MHESGPGVITRRPGSNPAPKLDCRASRQNCANIDTPDTNWQPNVWEENF